MSTESSCPNEHTEIDSNKPDNVSHASLDIFKDLAIIDEGLRGIGSTTPQPATLQSCIIGKSRFQSEKSYATQISKTDERSLQPASTSSDDSSVDIEDQSIQNEEDHRSLSVNISPRASAYSVTSSDGRMQNSPSIADRTGALCDLCDKIGPDTFFCNMCELVYCEMCWIHQPVHNRKRTVNAIPHERTDYSMAKKIQNILSPDLTQQERERLHESDISTTWFGVFRQKGELPLLREYGRYTDLINQLRATRAELQPRTSGSLHSEPPDERLYPSLVSFVGETGAGKSTLIKLLIDLKSREGDAPQTPIIGAAGRDIATSEDVHLYLDPETSLSHKARTPLLYADCEGLNGGNRDPVGALCRQTFEAMSQEQEDAEDELAITRLKLVSQRPLAWANQERHQSREFKVAQLYPRLLYAFSDVVVFVLRNPRVIEGVLERLLSWAETALERSSNQPILPCAIIALNASENNIEDDLWDADQATLQLMESLSEVARSNQAIKKYIGIWKCRGQSPNTVEQLLWLYYRSVRVVRIPTRGRPNLIQRQVLKLYGEIHEASRLSQKRKTNLRMLLDADDFAPYLQYALDHFAHSLDTAFDFVQASFAYSPIPLSLGGSILKLAIKVMDCWEDLIKAETIFEELSYIVASCIMLDMARNDIMGTPWRVFPRYIEHLDDALENFADRYWPCEFIGLGGLRCVNVRSGHQKGHQVKSGTLISFGSYQSTFSFESYREEFATDVYSKLGAIMSTVIKHSRSGRPELQSVVQIHRKILPAFFSHTLCWEPKLFTSNTICFACLMEAPLHVLPCGHILCTRCLMTFGTQRHNSIDISECPLESSDARFETTWTVRLKPKNCGVRVLSLDGGGVRGLIQLEIMEEIERQLGSNLNIRKFFDLIVGTGTGGIIALELAASKWNLQRCSEQFESLCTESFATRVGSNVPVLGKLVGILSRVKYESQPLLDHLQDMFSSRRYFFGGQQEDHNDYETKVAVTAASSAGKVIVLTNYNRSCQERLPYHFQRPETQVDEFKIWEVAHAIFVRPKLFKPFRHPPSNHIFSNDSMQHENPIGVAENERCLIWPELKDEEPDLMVSIGTAYNRPPIGSVTSMSNGIWSKPHSKLQKRPSTRTVNRRQALSRMKKGGTAEECEWNDYLMNRRSLGALDRYVRVNVLLTESIPKFDDIHDIPRITHETRYWKRNDPQVQTIAKRLVASCFYFDVDGNISEHQLGQTTCYEARGNYRCRLTSKSDIAGLGSFIQRNSIAGFDPFFLVQCDHDEFRSIQDTEGTEIQTQRIFLTSKIIERMKNEGLFRMDETLSVWSTAKTARTLISICYNPGDMYSISRFPRRLHDDQPVELFNVARTRIGTSTRWASRTYEQRQRMANWVPVHPAKILKDGQLVEKYCGSDHFFGRITKRSAMDTHVSRADAKRDNRSSAHSLLAIAAQQSSTVRGLQVGEIQEFYAPNIREDCHPLLRSRSPDAIVNKITRKPLASVHLNGGPSELSGNPIHELSATNTDSGEE